MTNLSRDEMKARSEMFDRFALKDQKNYYSRAISKHRKAATQVNRIRAWMAVATGVTAALAGFLVQSFVTGGTCSAAATDPASYCNTINFIMGTLAILAVILPSLGGAFSTLADLYQWDKLIDIYKTALANMEQADALSPIDLIPDDLTYRASMRAFTEGTLQVMTDETSQWGQSIRTPRQLDEFVREEQLRVNQTIDSLNEGFYKDRLKKDDDDQG